MNGQRVTEAYILKNGDLVANHLVRHEPPVSAEPITVLHQSDQVLVVNKPSSIPVHPCGRYRYNTALSILEHENKLAPLFRKHRAGSKCTHAGF